MQRALTLACALGAAATGAAAAELASPIGTGPAPAPPWRVVGLPQQAKPLTQFAVAELDGQRLLRIEADHAYGTLVHDLKHARAGTLTWRWRVDQAPAGADLHKKSGDDAALKVCAMFDMPLADVPFIERQLLRLASARVGEKLPTATLCYVWDAQLAQGTLLNNAYTRRVRFVVTHGTPGRWHDERHDLAADFRRAFGDEWHGGASDTTPALAAIVIGADSDNTGTRSLAWLGDLTLTPAP